MSYGNVSKGWHKAQPSVTETPDFVEDEPNGTIPTLWQGLAELVGSNWGVR